MYLVGVIAHKREQQIVGLGDSPTETAAIDIAHHEILKKATLPAFPHGHLVLPLLC